MNLLLHTCCSACAPGPFRELSAEGHAVTALFYNPNVHLLIEFRRRLKAMKVLQEHQPIPVIYVEQYGLREFLENVNWRGDERCTDCYRLRLDRTAHEARERGFEAISTTLLGSTHQDHDLIRQVGVECALREGLQFVARDWRPLAEEGHREASRLHLYRQQYCGCIFSEYDRFKDGSKHLYRSEDG